MRAIRVICDAGVCFARNIDFNDLMLRAPVLTFYQSRCWQFNGRIFIAESEDCGWFLNATFSTYVSLFVHPLILQEFVEGESRTD